MTILTPSQFSIKNHHESASSREKKSVEGVQAPFKKLFIAPCEGREDGKKDLFSLIEEELEEEAAVLAELPTPPPFLGASAPFSLESAAASLAPLHSSLPLAMEKMIGTLILMHCTGETHTTLCLDQPQFANSPFFGTQITIKEFSTAPKAFNIEIISNPASLLSIQKGSETLLSLFAKGDFGFSVHRLEISASENQHPSYQEDEGAGGGHSHDRNEEQES